MTVIYLPSRPSRTRAPLCRFAAVYVVLAGVDAAVALWRCAELAGIGTAPDLPFNTAAPGVLVAGIWLMLRSRWRTGARWTVWTAAACAVAGAALASRRRR